MEIVTIGISDRPAEQIALREETGYFCVFLDKALDGQEFALRCGDISCPLARYSFGISAETPERMNGLARVLVRWGDVESREKGLRYLQNLPRTELAGKFLAFRPWTAKADGDLAVVRGRPVEIMELIQKYSRPSGEKINFSIAGIGASC